MCILTQKSGPITKIFILFCGCSFVVNCVKEDEPICTSRFDFDHKLLQSLVMLETENKVIKAELEQRTKDIKTLEGTMREDRKKLSILEKTFESIGDSVSFVRSGATFVRWGRTTCPSNGTELVYKGFAAGSNYNKPGSAANYICLPEEPLWNAYEDSEQTTNAVYGVEYEFHYRNMAKFFGKELKERDVPCCVCQTKRTSVLMIPGRNRCYDGWTLEFHGYLVAGHDGHEGATEFVCLDEDPEVLVGGINDEDGKLFYIAEARCGSLRCPPYVNGRELTCVVCTK